MEDLATISRMLELPHGRDIATEMLRELAPYLKELSALSGRDPTGAVKLVLDYADELQTRLRRVEASETKELTGTASRRDDHVA